MVVDRSRGITFVNQAAETLTGLSARNMLTRDSDDLFHANGWLLAMIDKSLGPDESTSRAENNFVRRRGKRVPVSALVSPLRDQDGGVAGSVLLLRDRTLRQAMEDDLRRSDRLALLGKLAAGLAHEIKNPLGGIKGAAQLIRVEVAHDASLLENTDIMIREVDRVNQLLDQLLDLARPAGLHLEALNVHELLEHVLGLEVHSAAAAKVCIERSFDPSLPFIVGDRSRLIQVFLNLVENAFQANPTCMTVATRMETEFSLRTERSSATKFVTVDIRDDGTGIDEEDLPDIFSPFFTRKRRGTGSRARHLRPHRQGARGTAESGKPPGRGIGIQGLPARPTELAFMEQGRILLVEDEESLSPGAPEGPGAPGVLGCGHRHGTGRVPTAGGVGLRCRPSGHRAPGRRRTDAARLRQGSRPADPVHRHDRAKHHAQRHRGHEVRRLRLSHQALRPRRPHGGGGTGPGPEAPQPGAQRPQGGSQEEIRARRQHDRHQRGHAGRSSRPSDRWPAPTPRS